MPLVSSTVVPALSKIPATPDYSPCVTRTPAPSSGGRSRRAAGDRVRDARTAREDAAARRRPDAAHEDVDDRRDQALEAVVASAIAVHAAHHAEEDLGADAAVDPAHVARRHRPRERRRDQGRELRALTHPFARVSVEPMLVTVDQREEEAAVPEERERA